VNPRKPTEGEHKENATQILNVLITYTPDDKAKEIVRKLPRETEVLTIALVDGLLYGNWPWITKL